MTPCVLHTTLNLLKLAGACGQRVWCGEGYDKLRQHLGKGWGKNVSIPLTTVLESNGFADALWCLRAVVPEEEVARNVLARLLAADYAEHVQHLYKPVVPDTGWRPAQTIRIARLFAKGAATLADLRAAAAAAYDAAYDAAYAASHAAERQWQAERLLAWLTGERTPEQVWQEMDAAIGMAREAA